MAEVAPVKLGVKSTFKNRGLVNVVKKQSSPSCTPAHSTKLGYLLSTPQGADVRGKEPQDCMAPKEGESVNCDHHAELSDWVRWG